MRDRCISRAALLDPTDAPFERVIQSKCDKSLITVTGFDFEAF